MLNPHGLCLIFDLTFYSGRCFEVLQPTAPTTKPVEPVIEPATEHPTEPSSVPNGNGEGSHRVSLPDGAESEEAPQVLLAATLTRAEIMKIKRIVTPKPYTGNIEVPQDIIDMWNTEQGKQKLFALWAKSGGVKVGKRLAWFLYLLFMLCSSMSSCYTMPMRNHIHGLGNLQAKGGDPICD